MRVWRVHSIHRLAWIMIALLILAVAIFAMATAFTRLHGEDSSAGADAGPGECRSGRFAAVPGLWQTAGAIAAWGSAGAESSAGSTRL
jgi:hypothetical protein